MLYISNSFLQYWIVAVLVYISFIVFYSFIWKRHKGKKDADSLLPRKKLQQDIIGKSKFVLPPPQKFLTKPNAVIGDENNKGDENKNIFASENPAHFPKQIATEELNKVFGIPPEGEENSPLEEIPMEMKEDSSDYMGVIPEELEGSEVLSMKRNTFVSYEKIGEAYRLISQNHITDEQKREAGRILTGLKGTDMFEDLVSEHEQNDRITKLIDSYLSSYNTNNNDESTKVEIPTDFNIQDFN